MVTAGRWHEPTTGKGSMDGMPEPTDAEPTTATDPRRRIALGQADESIGSRDLGRWTTWMGRLLLRAFRWLERTIRRYSADGSLSLAALVTAGLGVLLLGASQAIAAQVYDNVLDRNGLAGWDRPVLDRMVSWRSPGTDAAVTHFTDIGGKVGGPILAVMLTVLLCLLWRRRTPAVLMGIAMAGSLLVTVLGKEATARVRPPTELAVPPFESSPSFPSGHTLNMTVMMGIAAYVLLVWLHRTWARVATVLVTAGMTIAMGLSRVYLGHHWLTDVIAAWFLGIGWVVAVVTVHRLTITVRRSRAEHDAGRRDLFEVAGVRPPEDEPSR